MASAEDAARQGDEKLEQVAAIAPVIVDPASQAKPMAHSSQDVDTVPDKGETNDVSRASLGSVAASAQEEHESTTNQGSPPTEAMHDLERGQTTSSLPPVHSVFSKRQKLFIIFMASFAGFFSPLSGNIYFPALNQLSMDLHVSSGLINLTLTTYMIFQGLAPTFFGDLADMTGRRPTYIIGFTIYIVACVGCAVQDSFAALLVIRCIQSTGSSSTIALASGVAADVATSAERGVYMGWVTSGALLGPAVGPIIGGVLSQFAGWRWIFWFLTILAGVYMIPLLIAFPETGGNVVGNGSIPPQGWNMSLLNYLETRRARKAIPHALERKESLQSLKSQRSALAARRKWHIPNPFHTLVIFAEKDVAALLFFNSMVFTAFYDITASLPYLFKQIYGFNDLQIGLCYIPFGVGCLLAPLINGRLLDWNFRRVARHMGVKIDKKRTTDLKDFPLERARVSIALPFVLTGDAAMLCYGWSLDANAPLAAPLVLLFIAGLCFNASFNCMSVMLVDYYPMSPSRATAGNNLARCWVGAGGTAVIVYMIDAMGRGWCFTFIAGVIALISPVLLVLLRWGPGWREARRVREEAKKAQKLGKVDER